MSVAVVDCAVEIRRSPEDVFECWEGEWIAGDPMLIDYLAYDRPKSWRSVGRSRGLLVASEGRVDPTPEGARLTLHVELAPQGRLRLIAPLLGRIMRGRERQNLAAIKGRLETNGGGQQ